MYGQRSCFHTILAECTFNDDLRELKPIFWNNCFYRLCWCMFCALLQPDWCPHSHCFASCQHDCLISTLLNSGPKILRVLLDMGNSEVKQNSVASILEWKSHMTSWLSIIIIVCLGQWVWLAQLAKSADTNTPWQQIGVGPVIFVPWIGLVWQSVCSSWRPPCCEG